MLEAEFESVTDLVDPTEYFVLDYVVRRFNEHRQDLLEDVVLIRDEVEPELVIGPSRRDVHQDHVVVANEMIRAFKSGPSIIAYEQPWNHVSFSTQLFSPISEADLDSKLEQLSQYDSQLERDRPYFDEQFLRSLARIRGLQASTQYAEAFEVIRWVL